jgi:subtilase family serine protease
MFLAHLDQRSMLGIVITSHPSLLSFSVSVSLTVFILILYVFHFILDILDDCLVNYAFVLT